MKSIIKTGNSKKSPAIIIMSVVIAALLVILILPVDRLFEKENVDTELEYDDVYTICELATLRSFYHNTGIYSGTGNDLLDLVNTWTPAGWVFEFGYEEYWIEYAGIVEYGVDASEIRISQPDENGVVTAYMPDADVLNVTADEDSISVVVENSGLLNSVSTETKAEIYQAAQQGMSTKAAEDTKLISQATKNAKSLVENYIKEIGDGMGKTLTVRWTNDKEDI